MLVNAGIYDKGLRVSLPAEEVYNSIPVKSADQFCWLAIKDPVESELRMLQTRLNIPDLVFEDILHGHQQPKMEEYADGLIFMVLNQYFWGTDGALAQGEVALIAAPQYIVSVRKGGGGDFVKVRQRAQEEKELLAKGPGFVLYAILDLVVDRYFPIIVEFERRIDALEDAMFTDISAKIHDRKKMAQDLHAIRRELGKFKQGVDPLLEASLKLFGGKSAKNL